jgi:hypothetical protein
MRRACRWTTRITQSELAAMNRLARFPASPRAARSASRRPPNPLALLFASRDRETRRFKDSIHEFNDQGFAIIDQ